MANMARKPTAIVQVNLRIREAERRKLEAAAKRNGVSMNGEIAARLARTFRETKTIEADQLIENVSRYLKPLADAAHERAKTADLIQAADKLVALLTSDYPAQDTIQAAVGRYGVVKHMIQIEAGIRVLSTHTTGAAP
jgi:hypothetical protein